MAADYSISSLVDRIRGHRAAVPGGTRRDFFGDRVVSDAHSSRTAKVRPIRHSTTSCPSCSATVTEFATSCRDCGHLLIRASA